MRTAIGLMTLGIVGSVFPVGFSVMPYLTPLLVGTIGALFILLALGLLISILKHRAWRFGPLATPPVHRRPVAPVRSTRSTAT